MKIKDVILTSDLQEVIKNHVDGYGSKEGKIISREWFIDVTKNKLAIKLTVDTSEPPDCN